MSAGNAKIGQPAPDFSATAVVGGQFKDIKLSDYRGNRSLIDLVDVFAVICELLSDILSLALYLQHM